MTTDNIFWGICAAIVLVMFIYYIKRERKLLSFLFGGLTGFIALVILNKYGTLIDIDVPLNSFNIAGSAVLGVPFVILLVIMSQFC
ncbi:MAG: pro-sigmaK processing inhibitor BofA family protein [Ruminococcus sp.]|nr:pro-sigmaK processing inhibitor BofA family protein [Ruminococcus sp.]